jgi:hypothetical protein
MREASNTLLCAAKALAKDLALPVSRASVFAWCDQAGERIVIAADQRWLKRAGSVPASFRGYRVEVQDELGAEVILPKQ